MLGLQLVLALGDETLIKVPVVHVNHYGPYLHRYHGQNSCAHEVLCCIPNWAIASTGLGADSRILVLYLKFHKISALLYDLAPTFVEQIHSVSTMCSALVGGMYYDAGPPKKTADCRLQIADCAQSQAPTTVKLTTASRTCYHYSLLPSSSR